MMDNKEQEQKYIDEMDNLYLKQKREGRTVTREITFKVSGVYSTKVEDGGFAEMLETAVDRLSNDLTLNLSMISIDQVKIDRAK
jgi:hypothetical protein